MPKARPGAKAHRDEKTSKAGGTIDPLDVYQWGPGDAVGTIIPLTEQFDLSKPGDYVALVALPTPGVGKPYWVAGPVKFRIGKDPVATKK